MKKYILFLIVMFGILGCARITYELWEVSYFAGFVSTSRIAVFDKKEQCESRLKDFQKSDSREEFYNRDKINLGKTHRFCQGNKNE